MYYKSDCDVELLEAGDVPEIIEVAKEYEIVLTNVADVRGFVEEVWKNLKAGLDNDTQIVYNYICWKSLYRKGLMLLDTYRDKIMPQIEEVYEIQKKVSLPDGDDELIGYIDLICSFVDEPGVKYIADNKTSSRAYKEDSVRTSEQLAVYSEYEENSKCAFIVLEKKIRKREPRVRYAIIKDDMVEGTINETFDKITITLDGINEEKFDKDYDECFQYGRKCEYYTHCRSGDMENLKYLEKKDA
jgi:hypothetical protein